MLGKHALRLHFLRSLLRQWRGGELLLIALALVLVVAALAAVNVTAQRVDDSLRERAGQLLGADLVITGDRPLPVAWREQATAAGLTSTSVAGFLSMVALDEATQLAEVRAVDGRFPLRGDAGQSEQLPALPAPGTAWVDASLAERLALQVGSEVQVGYIRLQVTRVIGAEGDAALEVFSISPKLVMHAEDLPASGLIAPGSRVNWRLLLAGPPRQVAALRAKVEAQLERGQRIEGLQDARPEVRSTLERARQFLALAGMASVVLAAVALVLAARRYTARRVDETALMRCWGIPFRRILAVHLGRLLLLGLFASSLGALLGLALQALLAQRLASFVGDALPPAQAAPVLWAAASGVGLFLATVLPPLLRLRQVSALRVLRADLPPLRLAGWAGYFVAGGALAGLMIWQAGDLHSGIYALMGYVLTLLVALVLGSLLVRLLGAARQRIGSVGSGLRLGLAAIARAPGRSVLQVAALAVGIMSLLLLTVVRGDLLSAWRASLPPDAPNRFVINLQPADLQRFEALFNDSGLPVPRSYPMVRGRLLAINGRDIDPEDYSDSRTRRLVEREFNLSFDAQPDYRGSRLLSGRWWAPDSSALEASVESGIASRLAIGIGDQLRYAVGGRNVELTVTSLREVDWDSFGVNFFVVASPAALAGEPTTWVASFYLPPDQRAFDTRLVQALPSINVIDVGELLERIRELVDRLAAAVGLLAWLTIGSGLLVVGAAVLAAQDERLREAALLRSLGASRRQLRGALLAELALTGVLAGVVASLGAWSAGALLATRVLDVPYHPGGWLLIGGPVQGVLLSVAAGWLVASRSTRVPPLQLLRLA